MLIVQYQTKLKICIMSWTARRTMQILSKSSHNPIKIIFNLVFLMNIYPDIFRIPHTTKPHTKEYGIGLSQKCCYCLDNVFYQNRNVKNCVKANCVKHNILHFDSHFQVDECNKQYYLRYF